MFAHSLVKCKRGWLLLVHFWAYSAETGTATFSDIWGVSFLAGKIDQKSGKEVENGLNFDKANLRVPVPVVTFSKSDVTFEPLDFFEV